ncbi:YjhX family toxin [Devosia sp. 2618]|uniref:YjhX family toxin n=1 Tax=Devosia sp. 2618 TaxID=3156454 RepID=UPI00339708A1
MDISRDEQRVLHALAQGGRIALLKNDDGKVTGLEFFNREGWLMNNCSLVLFRKLKAKRAIKSQGGRPYQITRRGLELVRSEVNNR